MLLLALREVMELCRGGELFTRIVAERDFTERTCAVLMQQIVRAINYLHMHGYVRGEPREGALIFETI